ncbi:porin family protein [Flavihumibacter stibioxidans]|uniref:Outer membrane protein beta-barrel domain-containing protein n=1 Tax=Flavihumibacter stibioxidans TaxID=1834163 RepID=A0ABR7M6L4_9BACT|nr:porin family protein [Flavihumibacter stibioxidans]MBC6490662.1 hypothetical protein [Flavihumibacter stibioxidans]
MKKTSLLVFGLLLFVYGAKSQSRIGLKAGFNLANQTKTMSIPQVPTSEQNTETLIGYQFGVFYKTMLSKNFSLSAEPAFSVIGSSMTLVASDGKSYETDEKLGYIELPLTLQYSFNKLYFGAGPSVGLKVFSKLSGFENRNFDITSYKSIDAAGNILVGYGLSNKIDINSRYIHGFMNIIKDPSYAKTKNKFFNLSVLFYLK